MKIPCAIYRGGSKPIFFLDKDLPQDPKMRDQVILAAFGSPDLRQIGGLGGADPLTSKVTYIGPPSVPNTDIDYTLKIIVAEFHVCDGEFHSDGTFSIDDAPGTGSKSLLDFIDSGGAVTGAVCLGAAAKIKGTIAHEIFRQVQPNNSRAVRIGHPSGTIQVEIEVEKKEWSLGAHQGCSGPHGPPPDGWKRSRTEPLRYPTRRVISKDRRPL
ncbi:MAG: PrpF domain-containing protein [Candidatus Bipolaricaulia bacterium]